MVAFQSVKWLEQHDKLGKGPAEDQADHQPAAGATNDGSYDRAPINVPQTPDLEAAGELNDEELDSIDISDTDAYEDDDRIAVLKIELASGIRAAAARKAGQKERVFATQPLTAPIYAHEPTTLGRSARNTVVVDSLWVSGTHLRFHVIVIDPNYPLCYVTDLSTNGVRLMYGQYIDKTDAQRASTSTVIGKNNVVLLTHGDRLELPRIASIEFSQLKQAAATGSKPRAPHMPSWQILPRQLGAGTYGVVCLARHRRTGAQVACKIIDQERYNAHHNVTDREIHILRSLNHPNVVRVHEIFVASGQTCVISELVPGGDLFSYLHTPGRKATVPGEAELLARYIVFQLLKALQYLHSRGIAHRDIKVENVLLWSNEAGARVVLTDFGAATLFAPKRADVQDDKRRRMVTQIGTTGNMAPEVIKAGAAKSDADAARHAYGPAADMWSLGCVLYEILIGRPAFIVPGEQADRTFRRILRGETIVDLKRPGADNVGEASTGALIPPNEAISRNAKDFVLKLLEKDAATRLDVSTALVHPWLRDFAPSFEATWHKRVCKPWLADRATLPPLTTLNGIPEITGAQSQSSIPAATVATQSRSKRVCEPGNTSMHDATQPAGKRRIIIDARLDEETSAKSTAAAS